MLNATKPTDQVDVSELPLYMRETRIEINKMSSELEVALAATTIVIGTGVQDVDIELVIITGAGAASIAYMTGGTQGQIKIFYFQDANVGLVDGVNKADGEFWLNQVAGTTFAGAIDDILAVMNIDGDGSSVQGYWKELYRIVDTK